LNKIQKNERENMGGTHRVRAPHAATPNFAFT